MNVRTTHLFQAVHDAVLTSEGAKTFARILAEVGDVSDPFTLAQLIEVDGRTRMMIGAPVVMHDYLSASPQVADERVVLDAAIDMTLKHRRRHAGDNSVIEQLVREYPQHEAAIREADMIDAVLCSTESMLRGPSRYRNSLPCDFGPVLEDGQQTRFQLQRLLGAGAYGEVYLAEDRQFSDEDHTATVAIKVMHTIHASEAARREFLDEATKARRIQHPNVVHVLDRGITRDAHDYIVYEFVETHGADLETLARTWTTRQTVEFVASLAEAVQVIHSAGLIHCDMKPGNILVTPEGEPRITDFGVAVRSTTARRQTPLYDDARPIGTIGFMAPEQYRGEEDALRPAADIYAVGGMLYWLLTGNVPNGPTSEAVARNLTGDHARPEPPQLDRHFPVALREICRRAMATDPEDRYPAAAMLAADLRLWLAGRPIPWMRNPPWRILSLWARRNPVASVFLCLALIGLGVGAWQAKVAYDQLVIRRATAPFMNFMAQSFRVTRASGFDAQQFSSIWTWEWLFGPGFLNDNRASRDLWSHRVEGIRARIELNRANGMGGSLETFNFELALAFWLVQDDQYEGVEARLTELESLWQDRLENDDRMLTVLRLLRDRATVNRMLDHPEQISRPQLEAIATRLEQFVAIDITTSADGAPMALLAARTGRRLYGPDLLDRPEDAARHKEREDKFLATTRFVPEPNDSAAQETDPDAGNPPATSP